MLKKNSKEKTLQLQMGRKMRQISENHFSNHILMQEIFNLLYLFCLCIHFLSSFSFFCLGARPQVVMDLVMSKEAYFQATEGDFYFFQA